ncbi:MAG: CHAT domain-containing protein [Alphaproteobacteria bacterium]
MLRRSVCVATAFGMLAAGGLMGCKEERPAVSLDQARQVTARFEGQQAADRIVPPPRTITDIVRVLEETKPDARQTEITRRAAEAQAPAGATGTTLASFLYERGSARAELGQTDAAIADFHAAVDLLGNVKSVELVRVLGELARAQMAAGQPLDSLKTRLRAIEIIEQDQTQRGALFAHYGLAALINANLGDIRTAEEFAARNARLLAQMTNRQGDVVRALSPNWRSTEAIGRAEVALARGDLAAADTAFRESVDNAVAAQARIDDMARVGVRQTRTSFSRSEALFSARHAIVLVRMGRLVEAELAARRGLTVALRELGRYHGDTAQTAISFASVLVTQGRHEEARLMGRAAEDILTKIGHKPTSNRLAIARRAVATASAYLGDSAEALRIFDQMAADLRSEPQVYRFAFSEALEYGEELLRANRAADAETLFRWIADDRRDKVGLKNIRYAEASGHLAAALAARGARAEALTLFKEAVPIMVSSSRGADDESGSVKREHYLRFVVERYLALLSDIATTPLAPQAGDIPAIAFELADALRGKGVQAALAASSARAAATDPDLADLVRREQDALRQIGALNGLLVNALSAPASQQNAQALQQLRTDIDTLRTARATIREEIERRFPTYTDLIDPRPATLVQARAQLRPGEALLATYVAEDRTYVWALRADGTPAFAAAPLGRKAIDEAVAGLRKALDPQAATLGDIPPFDVAGANRLFASLMEPVSAGWKGARDLLVVPHGALGQLPFGVLVTKPATLAADREGEALFASYRAVPFLAREAAVTQLPSVASLAALRRLPPGDASRKAFIGFGDPLFNAEQAAEAARETAPTQVAMRGAGTVLATRAVPLVRRNAPATNTVDSAEIGILPRLPDTADEVRSIAQALKADPATDVITGRAANEQAVATMRLSDRRVVMFATHGLVPGDLNGLTQPALALSAPQVTGMAGDGLLTLDEIVGLKLNADWVVMSACNTAAGDGAGAEAVSGLGRGFFYAGTRAVLVTNWPVETTSARELTTDLFRRQAASAALGRAEAMRQAMVGLIDGPGYVDPASRRPVFSYAHPIFWAPFSLVGDGGGGPGT